MGEHDKNAEGGPVQQNVLTQMKAKELDSGKYTDDRRPEEYERKTDSDLVLSAPHDPSAFLVLDRPTAKS